MCEYFGYSEIEKCLTKLHVIVNKANVCLWRNDLFIQVSERSIQA